MGNTHLPGKFWRTIAIAILIFVQLACKAVQPENKNPTQEPGLQPTTVAEKPAATLAAPDQPTEVPTEAAPPVDPTAAPLANAGDLACFGTLSLGLTCLGSAGWQSYSQDNSSLSSDSIQDIAACPNGQIAVVNSNGVAIFDGSDWKQVSADLSAVIGASAIACDIQNNFWVAFMSGVSHWDGKGWATFPPETVAPGGNATIFDDIAAAPDGTIWAVSDATVSKFDGANWTVFQEGQGFGERFYFNSLALDSQGLPWVGQSNGLVHYDGNKWQEFGNSKAGSIEDLAVDSQGRVWAATSANGLYLFDKSAWTSYDLQKEAGVSNSVRSLAVDTRDRVWITTEYGLAIYDGASWTSFYMHNADLVENDLHGIGILSGGPDLPAPTDKENGILSARILDSAGQPVANAPVEICVEILGPIYYGETPCSEQPFILKTQTDAEGNFSLGDLPPGYYIITVYAKDTWAQLVGQFGSFSERVLIRAGQTTNVGDITLQD